MSVVGLHPEELFDKLLEGELSPSERERLSAHLAGCEVCRFEHAARLDFQDEALALGRSAPPVLLPLLPAREPQAAVVVASTRRRRSRLLVWGVAAAALITASGALASVVTGRAPWRAVKFMFSERATSAVTPQLAAHERSGRSAAPVAPSEPSAVAAPAALVTEPSALVAPSSASELAAPTHAVAAHPDAAHAPVRAKLVAAPAVVAAATAAPAAAASPVDAKEAVTAGKLFAEANQARRSGDIGRASGLYHLLQDQFSGSPEAELSRVTLSLLLLDSGDAQGALGGFERYLAGSSHGLEAEALVGRARALGRLGRRDLEASAWQEVQRKYPRSIYGRQAGERLSALGLP